MAELSPLRRRMIEDMFRNLSPATQRSYISTVRKLSRYFARSPDRLGLGGIHTFHRWPTYITEGFARTDTLNAQATAIVPSPMTLHGRLIAAAPADDPMI